MNVHCPVHGCHTSTCWLSAALCPCIWEDKIRKMMCSSRAVSLPPQGDGSWRSDWLWVSPYFWKSLILLALLLLGDSKAFFAWWSSQRSWKWLFFECSKSFLQMLPGTILKGAVPCPSSQWVGVSQLWQMNCGWKAIAESCCFPRGCGSFVLLVTGLLSLGTFPWSAIFWWLSGSSFMCLWMLWLMGDGCTNF